MFSLLLIDSVSLSVYHYKINWFFASLKPYSFILRCQIFWINVMKFTEVWTQLWTNLYQPKVQTINASFKSLDIFWRSDIHSNVEASSNYYLSFDLQKFFDRKEGSQGKRFLLRTFWIFIGYPVLADSEVFSPWFYTMAESLI